MSVRILDDNFDGVTTRFYDMNLFEGTDAFTAVIMIDIVNNIFDQNDIQQDRCMGIGLDNKTANIGK